MGRKSRIKKERRLEKAAAKSFIPQVLREELDSLDQKVLLLVTGLPFSGKTTFARRLSKNLGYPAIEQDSLHQEAMPYLLALQVDPSDIKTIQILRMAYFAYVLMGDLESNNGVIGDTVDLIHQGNRYHFMELAKSISQSRYKMIIFWMDTDLGTCLQRFYQYEKEKAKNPHSNSARDSLTQGFLIEHARAATPPKPEEGFTGIYYVRQSPSEYNINSQPMKVTFR